MSGRVLDRRVRVVVLLGAGTVALVALVVAMVRDTSWNWWVWNADSLTPYVVAGDVLSGGSFGHWHMAHSPYLFPDVLLSALAWLVSGGGGAGVVVVGVVQVLVVSLATGRLAGSPSATAVSAGSITVVVFALLAVWVREPFVLLVGNGHHAGAFVVGVVTVAWLWGRVRSGREHSRVSTAAVAVWCSAAALSDLLFVAQVSVPMVVWLVFVGRSGRVVTAVWVRPVVGVVAGSVLGLVAAPMVVPNWVRVPGGVSLDGVVGRLGDLVDVMVRGQGRPVAGGVVGVLVLVVNVGCALWVVRWSWRVVRRRPMESAGVLESPVGVVAVWVGVAWMVMIGLVAVSSSFPVAERYLLVAWFGPVVLAVVWVSGRGWVVSRSVATGAVVAALVVAGVAVWVEPVAGAPWLPGTAELACVDTALAAAGAESVVVQYWDAKVFAVHLGDTRRYAQHSADGAEYRFATSGAFFETDHRYDAIVTSGHAGPVHAVDPAVVIALAGAPLGDVSCGPWRVLTYGDGGLLWGDG